MAELDAARAEVQRVKERMHAMEKSHAEETAALATQHTVNTRFT